LKEVVDVYTHQVAEVAMDSTCKFLSCCVTNSN
jgi:hypothetical protein